jgi:broad specificity phosphatase PhoE
LIVRHAEKDAGGGTDPQLSAEGLARVQELVQVTGNADVSAVFATQYIRTQQTVQPLASHLGLAVDEYNAVNTANLVALIRSDHTGEVIVVAGHSNTISEIIEEFGGDPIDPIIDGDYDNLFVVTVFGCGGVEVVHLEYGEPT